MEAASIWQIFATFNIIVLTYVAYFYIYSVLVLRVAYNVCQIPVKQS